MRPVSGYRFAASPEPARRTMAWFALAPAQSSGFPLAVNLAASLVVTGAAFLGWTRALVVPDMRTHTDSFLKCPPFHPR